MDVVSYQDAIAGSQRTGGKAGWDDASGPNCGLPRQTTDSIRHSARRHVAEGPTEQRVPRSRGSSWQGPWGFGVRAWLPACLSGSACRGSAKRHAGMSFGAMVASYCDSCLALSRLPNVAPTLFKCGCGLFAAMSWPTRSALGDREEADGPHSLDVQHDIVLYRSINDFHSTRLERRGGHNTNK